MAEDYTSYTQSGTLTGIAFASSSITCNPTASITGYAYYDYSAGAFVDFDNSFAIKITDVGTTPSSTDYIYPWTISNQLPVTTECIFVRISNDRKLSFGTMVGGAVTSTLLGTLALNTTYYVRITLDTTIGTYGTLFCYVYSDPLYMNLLYTDTMDLTISVSYQYIYCFRIDNTTAGTFKCALSSLRLCAYRLSADMILDKVYLLVGEKTLNNFSREELMRYMNDAEREMSMLTGCIQSTAVTATAPSSDTVSYTAAYRAKYIEKSGYSLMPQSMQQIGRLPSSVRNPYYWFNIASNTIKLDPVPSSADTLTIYTTNEPEYEISFRGDINQSPPEYRDIIYLYVLSRIYHKMNNIGLENFFLNLFYNMMSFLSPLVSDVLPDATDSTRWPDQEVS